MTATVTSGAVAVLFSRPIANAHVRPEDHRIAAKLEQNDHNLILLILCILSEFLLE